MNLFTQKRSAEFAQVVDGLFPQWETGAPLPQVFANGIKTYLTYLVQVHDASWDGTYITGINPSADQVYTFALIEFNADTFRFGLAGDEVHSGLPLWNKGLKHYSAHIIENSSWLKELKRIHKTHPHYDEARWKNKKHYCFLFHDDIFEIIATDFRIETHETTFQKLAIEIATRMNR
jgi:hypothetical protein